MAIDTTKFRYWLPCSESSGTRSDSTSYANNFTDGSSVGAGAALATAFSASLALVKASTDYIYCNDNANISVSNESFFITGWLRTASNTTLAWLGGQWHGASATTDRCWRIYITSGSKLAATVRSSTTETDVTATTFGNLSNNTTYFFYFQHEQGVGLKLRMNDASENTAAHTSGVNNSSFQHVWGTVNNSTAANYDGSYWNGLLGPVGFGKGLLTSGEITELYNSGNGNAWPFSSGQPASKRMGGVRFANRSFGLTNSGVW